MKNLFLLLFCCFVVQLSYAQATFEYDAAGNRVKRTGNPDLISLTSVTPSTAYGTTNMTAVISLFELNHVSTVGLITVYISKDALLNFSFNPSATIVGGTLVQNANWSFNTSNPNFWILTSSTVIAGGGASKIGLTGVITPGNTKGTLPISTIVVGGGDTNASNNSSGTTIQYFNK